MPQPRSSTAVWIVLALIVASIACVMLGFREVRAAGSPTGLSTAIFILYVTSLIGSVYFALRLGFAGLMIVFGKPINRTVAWSSAFGALVHCAIILAIVVATIVLAPPQGFPLVATGLALALIALYAMGQYPNLAETQGWDVAEPEPTSAPSRAPTPRMRAKTPSASPARPTAVPAPIVRVATPPMVAPPIATEAPRATGRSDEREPSLLR